MKKLIGALLTMSLVLAVTACGTTTPPSSSSSSKVEQSSQLSSSEQVTSSSIVESVSSEEISSESISSSEVQSSSESSSSEVISNSSSVESSSSEESSSFSESSSSEEISNSTTESSSSEESSSFSESSSSESSASVESSSSISTSTSTSESVSSSASSSSSQEVIVCEDLTISGFKTDFTNGEEFSIGDLIVTAVMSNDTSEQLDASYYEVDSSEYNKYVAGSYTIRVIAYDITKEYTVTVGEAYATDIKISGFKTEFINGEDFSLGNLVVEAKMSDTTTKTLTDSEYVVDSTDYQQYVAGSYAIRITAYDITKVYTVEVGEPYALGIEVSGVKTTFNYGEAFATGDIVVKALMSDTTTKTLTDSEYTVNSSSFDAFTAGSYTITVTSGTLTESYTVTVEEGIISSISLSGQKTQFAFAEDFSTSGLVVTATYQGGATKVLSASEYTVDSSTYNFMKASSYTIKVTANGTNVNSTYETTVKVADKLKVLMIGNSYADDTINNAWEVATALGISSENVVVADLYIGGCVIDTHWSNWQNNSSAYRFGLEGEGAFDGSSYSNWTIKQGIEYTDWDFITFQQGSAMSGVASSYANLQSFMEEVYKHATDTVNNPNANPNVKFVWNQTWAYASNSTNSGFTNYNSDQMTMYNAILNCLQSQILTNDNFVAIIPSGTAIQNARTSLIGDNLTRDMYDHLDHTYGRYMTSLNLVSVLTGRDISNITWATSGVVGVYKDICIESVKNAQANPLQITVSTYPEPDISSLYKFDWQPIGGSYWWSTHETNYNNIISSVANAVNFVSSAKRFTQEELPVGTVIKIAEGYQVRPDAWDDDDTKIESSRPDNYTQKWLEITEEFWTGYTYRAFNLSKKDGSSLDGMFEEASLAMEIYVPYQTTEKTNTYYEADKAVLPTIDNYTRYDWMPTNGYYFASGAPTLNVSDATNGQKYVVPKMFTRQQLPVGSVIIIDAGYRYRPVYTSGFDTSATFGRDGLTTCTTASTLLITDDFWGDYKYRSFNVGPNTGTTNQDPYGTAEHFRIYIPNDPCSSFDWKPTDVSYWHSDSSSGNHNYLITGNTTATKFVSSAVMFTKEDLPVGSIITIASGWQYRAEGWNANKDRNGADYSGLTRPSNVSTSFVVVTEEWWGDFTYRAFNVSKTGSTVLTEEELVTAKSALQICVPFSGEGTETNPYQIKTEQDMWELSHLSYQRNYGKDLYFKLMNDIDLSAKNWQPICFNGITNAWPGSEWYTNGDYAFEGVFDGNNKTITLKIDSAGSFGMGLFSGLSGTIKNLTVNGSVSMAGYSGAVVGRVYNGAIIEGVTNNATVTASGEHVGGIVGTAINNSVVTIKNCVNNGSVSGTTKVGGILGQGWAPVTYINCDNTGNITGTSNVGGICGETHTSTWANSGLDADCSNTGTITGTSADGLVGLIN